MLEVHFCEQFQAFSRISISYDVDLRSPAATKHWFRKFEKNGYSISEYEKSKIAAIAEEQAKGIIFPLRQRPPENNRMLLSLFSKI